jgi:RimJ/RimL family protein N-acetyltransferase
MTQPLLSPIPEQLETDRLLLRVPRAGDGVQVYEAVVESLVSLRRFPASLPWVMAEPSVDNSEAYCRLAFSSFIVRKDLPFLLFSKASGALVGCAGFHHINWGVPSLEIGYWCRDSQCGQGYITEAVNALARMALDELKAQRIQILTDEENAASCRVCERAGFTLEGTLRHERRAPDGSLRNTRLYALIA